MSIEIDRVAKGNHQRLVARVLETDHETGE
jgi:hypothetical protein